ncbi:MAG: hypothetical protein N2050_08020 [Flavobacteriales bacterium]|nr:hypothetical protein [Flavobacteriales bacterium]
MEQSSHIISGTTVNALKLFLSPNHSIIKLLNDLNYLLEKDIMRLQNKKYFFNAFSNALDSA